MAVSVEEAIASKEFYEGYQYYEHHELHGAYPDGKAPKNPYVDGSDSMNWNTLDDPSGRWRAGACSNIGSGWLGILAGTKPTWSPPVENLQLSLFDEV